MANAQAARDGTPTGARTMEWEGPVKYRAHFPVFLATCEQISPTTYKKHQEWERREQSTQSRDKSGFRVRKITRLTFILMCITIMLCNKLVIQAAPQISTRFFPRWQTLRGVQF